MLLWLLDRRPAQPCQRSPSTLSAQRLRASVKVFLTARLIVACVRRSSTDSLYYCLRHFDANRSSDRPPTLLCTPRAVSAAWPARSLRMAPTCLTVLVSPSHATSVAGQDRDSTLPAKSCAIRTKMGSACLTSAASPRSACRLRMRNRLYSDSFHVPSLHRQSCRVPRPLSALTEHFHDTVMAHVKQYWRGRAALTKAPVRHEGRGFHPLGVSLAVPSCTSRRTLGNRGGQHFKSQGSPKSIPGHLRISLPQIEKAEEVRFGMHRRAVSSRNLRVTCWTSPTPAPARNHAGVD